MSAPPFSLDGWRRFKERRDDRDRCTAWQSLADISADAEMDEGIVLGCWNGGRFVSWEEWMAAVPLDRAPDSGHPAVKPDSDCVSAICGSTPEKGTQSTAKIRRYADPAQRQLPLLGVNKTADAR
jgi:hypothetical protein